MASSRDVIKGLTAAGWTCVRISGDHHTFRHPSNPLIITIAHPVRDVSIGVLRTAQKISGLKF